MVSTELSRRTLLTRASTVPTETAIQIAKAIRLQVTDVAESEALQLSLQDLIVAQPDLTSRSSDDARRLAEDAIASHRQRVDAAYSQQRAAMSEDAKRRATLPVAPSVLTPATASTSPQPVTVPPRERRQIRGLRCALLELIGVAVAWASIGLAVFLGISIDYTSNLDRRWWEPVGGLLVAVALAFLGGYL